MGEEYGETQPFQFFCDYTGELGEIVRKGRMAEAEGFGGLKQGKTAADLPDPNAISTFDRVRSCQWQRDGKRRRESSAEAMSRELIRLRQTYVVPLLKRPGRVASAASDSADGTLAISWTFGGSDAGTARQPEDSPLAVPPFDGAVIFERSGRGQHALEDGKLAPHSVVFAIDPEPAE